MFGFGKKEKKDKKRTEPELDAELKAFAADYEPEELDILAVTGPVGFGGVKRGSFWQASIGLTAWMEEDSPDIHQEEIPLFTLADNSLLDFLRQRTPPDFIIKFQGRREKNGKSMLLLNLPEPGFDPDLKAILEDLKAILEAQKQSVTLEVDGLGLFTLNRRVRWFEAEIDWCGASVQLDFDQGEPEEMAKAQEVARTLLADAENWDRRVREYAAGELTSLANDWAEGEEELTPEDFMARMELSAIQVEPDGEFEFWFEDGEMFYGHSIHVMGNLTDGPDWAQMEG